LLSSAFAAYHFSDLLLPYLGKIPAGHDLAILIITVIISYITLLFGETYPKELALLMPEKIAMNTAGLILFLQGIFSPFTWLLTASTKGLKKITPVDFDAQKETMTRDEFRSYL